MEAYEFYRRDPIRGDYLFGILPERRRNPERITQESIINWVKISFGNELDTSDIFFIQLTLDKNTGKVQKNRRIIFYKVFYKNYELKRNELMGMLTERRKDCRGKTQFESGMRWARLKFGGLVKDKQAIFVVPGELDLSESMKKNKN